VLLLGLSSVLFTKGIKYKNRESPFIVGPSFAVFKNIGNFVLLLIILIIMFIFI
jgi:hypothetical protein